MKGTKEGKKERTAEMGACKNKATPDQYVWGRSHANSLYEAVLKCGLGCSPTCNGQCIPQCAPSISKTFSSLNLLCCFFNEFTETVSLEVLI